MTTKEQIKHWIETGIPGAQVIVCGDDGRHFQARVTASQFNGKSMLVQHKMVYAALGDKMGNDIHALTLDTSSAH